MPTPPAMNAGFHGLHGESDAERAHVANLRPGSFFAGISVPLPTTV
jgi:hypothetical protein